MTLFLYLLTQDEAQGYDTYDSCVVAAESHADATTIHPRRHLLDELWWKNDDHNCEDWASTPRKVKSICIGEAKSDVSRGVICASFNAG
jgi:hypothetical protein